MTDITQPEALRLADLLDDLAAKAMQAYTGNARYMNQETTAHASYLTAEFMLNVGQSWAR